MLSRLMTVREQLLLLGLGAAIVLGAVVLIWRGNAQLPPTADTFAVRSDDASPSRPPALIEPTSAPSTPPLVSPTPRAEPVRIGIGVLGAVAREGLYYFDAGARVQDLLDSAGGTLPEADLSDINRTAILIDETTLLVPRVVTSGGRYYSDPRVTHNPTPYTRSTWYPAARQTTSAAATSDNPATVARTASPAANGGLININTASQGELESLPGIGPVTAKKIIAHRQTQPFARPEDLENVSGIGPAKMGAVRNLITVK